MIRDEFVFGFGTKRIYRIEDLDYYDDIIHEENARFWNDVARGYAIVFMQKTKRYEPEPELVPIGTMPVQDAIKKFG